MTKLNSTSMERIAGGAGFGNHLSAVWRPSKRG